MTWGKVSNRNRLIVSKMHLVLTNNFTLHNSGTRRRNQWMSLRKWLYNPKKRNVWRSKYSLCTSDWYLKKLILHGQGIDMSIFLLNLLEKNFVFLSPKRRTFQKKCQWKIRVWQSFQPWGRLLMTLMNITRSKQKWQPTKIKNIRRKIKLWVNGEVGQVWENERGELSRVKLKKGYKIEMCFSYPDEFEENSFMWCCGVVERVKTKDDKLIKLDIKWDDIFVLCGESDKIEDILKNICGILAHRGKVCGSRTCENT